MEKKPSNCYLSRIFHFLVASWLEDRPSDLSIAVIHLASVNLKKYCKVTLKCRKTPQSIDQSINQSINQSIIRSKNHSREKPIKQSIDGQHTRDARRPLRCSASLPSTTAAATSGLAVWNLSFPRKWAKSGPLGKTTPDFRRAAADDARAEKKWQDAVIRLTLRLDKRRACSPDPRSLSMIFVNCYWQQYFPSWETDRIKHGDEEW